MYFNLAFNVAVSTDALLKIYDQIVFFGIDNIHAMRESLSRLRDYLDTYGTTSSDGMSSYLVSLHFLF